MPPTRLDAAPLGPKNRSEATVLRRRHSSEPVSPSPRDRPATADENVNPSAALRSSAGSGGRKNDYGTLDGWDDLALGVGEDRREFDDAIARGPKCGHDQAEPFSATAGMGTVCRVGTR